MKPSLQKKQENLILYLSSQVKFNCKKKLAKLLYFVDFTNYEARSESLTGMKYQKYTYGPIPFDYYLLLENMEKRGLIKLEEKKIAGGNATLVDVIPLNKPDLSCFSKDEAILIQSIVEKFKNSTAGELEKLAKDEPPYIMVKYKDEIPYHLAYYRNTFGEMDLEDENPGAPINK